VLDWATNVLLDTRTISAFNGGQYLVWNIRGRVKIVVNKVGAKTGVVSGIYFGGPRTASPTPTPTPTPSPTPSPSPTPTPAAGFPQVTLTVPTNGSTFVAGQNITLAATATDPGGSISRVEFYRSGTLIGTDTVAPYSAVWTNAQKGNYDLVARATDNAGNTSNSAVVSISVTNSPNSVSRARGRAGSLVQQSQEYAGAADSAYVENPSLASDISALTTDIEQAYAEFKAEIGSFGFNATTIDTQIKAAALFSKASNGLALRAANSPNIKNNLLRIASHLTIAEEMMRFGVVSSAAITQANSTKTRTDVVVGQAMTGYGLTNVSSIAPSSLAAIGGYSNVQPMSTQTMFATISESGALPYEVAGLSVTVGGVAVPVVYVSPWGIKFFVPAEIQPGMREVIVTSQDGYVCQGTVSIEKGSSRLMTSGDDENGAAIVANNQTIATTNLSVVTPQNLSADKRTRLSVFATGISGSVSNTNIANDINVGGVVRPNFAESVAVEARLGDGRVYSLPVEFAGAQGVLPGLDQVNVRLIPELSGAGTVQLTLIVGGRRSNAPTVVIQ
jgi:uncharacterized protein (TIGR03437 family)